MAEDPASPASPEDGVRSLWKISYRRSRKTGCSNIFTGVNLHQLRRLFRTAGDRHAEHRARLVWQGKDAGGEGAGEDKEADGGGEEERGDEAGLAQALVGLRVRARTKAGIRVEGQRDQTWPRASGYLRPVEPLSGNAVDDEEADRPPSPGGFLLENGKDVPENQNPFKPSSWRSGVARQEGARDSERYLHRILH